MRILAVGGGSGGHVTPIVATIAEIKALRSDADIRFWCDTNYIEHARSTMHTTQPFLKVETISSGKFRRYHGIPWHKQLLDVRNITWPNIIDGFKIAVGILQSFIKLIAWRPDVVFAKGGYVCLPVGIAAYVLRIPIIVHDSDAHPGLTNRILSRWASAIATGAPLEFYDYPREKARYIGIPVTPGIEPLKDFQRQAIKTGLGFREAPPLIVVTGGGLGAQRLNASALSVIDELLKIGSVLIVSGTTDYEHATKVAGSRPTDSLQVRPFISEGFQRVLGAADVVVSRAGATTLLELAALARPAVIVPNANLTGGHQLKNAEVYKRAGAVVIVDDEELSKSPQLLIEAITSVINDKTKQKQLSDAIFKLAKPDAAENMARLIIATAEG